MFENHITFSHGRIDNAKVLVESLELELRRQNEHKQKD